jgi:hypothetical protein
MTDHCVCLLYLFVSLRVTIVSWKELARMQHDHLHVRRNAACTRDES